MRFSLVIIKSSVALLMLVCSLNGWQGVDRNELKQNVKWCIFHEGCRVYTIQNAGEDPARQQMASIAWLRGCYMDVQSHNQHAQDVIRNANDALLMAVTLEAAAEIPGEFQLDGAFQWVAYHEGQMPQFRLMNAQANFEGIRTIYFDKQSHNPNAANLLSAVTNRYIRDLINRL